MQYNQRKQVILNYLYQRVVESFLPVAELVDQENLDQLPGVNPGEILAGDVSMEINELIKDGHLEIYTHHTPLLSINWVGPPDDVAGFEQCAKEWIANKRADQD